MSNIVLHASQQALTRTSVKSGHKLDGAIPQTFFAPTVEYLQTQTDAPRGFVFNGLLMTVGAILGNRIHFDSGREAIRPNLYMMFVAGSTINRKSVGVSFATKTLGKLEERVGEYFLMPTGGSIEGLIDAMRDRREGERKIVYNSGLSAHGEMSGFIATMNKEYNGGFKEFILAVYDGDEVSLKLKKEESKITDPCLSLIGGITMAQLKTNIREVDKHSGFLQRFMFVYEPVRESRMRSIIQRAQPDPEREEEMFSFLEQVYQTSVQIKGSGRSFCLSSDAEQVYQRYFDEAHEDMRQIQIKNGDLGEML